LGWDIRTNDAHEPDLRRLDRATLRILPRPPGRFEPSEVFGPSRRAPKRLVRPSHGPGLDHPLQSGPDCQQLRDLVSYPGLELERGVAEGGRRLADPTAAARHPARGD